MAAPDRGASIVAGVVGVLSAATAVLVASGLALSIVGISWAEGVLAAGLLSIVALPVFRLTIVIGSLVRAREWRFVWTGIAILALLAVTLLWRSG